MRRSIDTLCHLRVEEMKNETYGGILVLRKEGEEEEETVDTNTYTHTRKDRLIH